MRPCGEKYDVKAASYAWGGSGGFSLAEMLAALIIGSMVLVAVLAVYSRAERAAGAVIRKLDSSRLPSEVLQRIAEDLDRVISAGSDAKISIENKFDGGFATAKLTILRTIVDSKNKQQTLEEIIWQSGYDFESTAEGLVLYRGHSGIMVEDKLLDEQRADWEKDYPLVPICSGVTFFRIQVPSGENPLDEWQSSSPPKGIVVTISFGEPFRTLRGTYEVAEEDEITRTIAIDRTRPIRFEIVPIEEEEEGNEKTEPIQL